MMEKEKNSKIKAKKVNASKKTKNTHSRKDKGSVKRLYKSQDDKFIAGVCGGIAEYFSIDPVWVRLIAVLLIFANGIGIILYVIAWILIPKNPNQKQSHSKIESEVEEHITQIQSSVNDKSERKGLKFIGLLFIGLGIYLLLDQFIPWMDFSYVWPLAIIALGIFLIVNNKK